MIPTIDLHQGDCLEVLRTLPDNSVDAVVSDPPYGLSDHKPDEVANCLNAWLSGLPYKGKGKGFMGKTWDAWVPGPEVWRECRLVTQPGGTVLDPFMGSGSTGRGAVLEGFNFIGIDLDPNYVEIARARIEHAAQTVEAEAESARTADSEPRNHDLFADLGAGQAPTLEGA